MLKTIKTNELMMFRQELLNSKTENSTITKKIKKDQTNYVSTRKSVPKNFITKKSFNHTPRAYSPE